MKDVEKNVMKGILNADACFKLYHEFEYLEKIISKNKCSRRKEIRLYKYVPRKKLNCFDKNISFFSFIGCK